MAFSEQTVNTRITATDASAEALRSAANNTAKLGVSANAVFAGVRRSIMQSLGTVLTVEFFRRSLVGFADLDAKVRQLGFGFEQTGGRIGSLRDEIERLAHRIGTTHEQIIEGMKAARQEMTGLTQGQTEKLAELGDMLAKQLDANTASATGSMTALFRQFGIGEEQWKQGAAALSDELIRSGVSIDDLRGRAERNADALAGMGYKGVEGMSRWLLLLRQVQQRAGNVRGGLMALDRLLDQIRDPSRTVKALYPELNAKQLKEETALWKKELEDMAAKHQDVIGGFAGMIENRLKETGRTIRETFDTKVAPSIEAALDIEHNVPEYDANMKKMLNATDDFMARHKKIMDEAKTKITELGEAYEDVKNSVGLLMAEMNRAFGPEGRGLLGAFSAELRKMAAGIEAVSASVHYGIRSKEAKEAWDRYRQLYSEPTKPAPKQAPHTTAPGGATWNPFTQRWEGELPGLSLPGGTAPAAPSRRGGMGARMPLAGRASKIDYRGSVLPFTRSDSGALSMSIPTMLSELDEYVRAVAEGREDPADPKNVPMNMRLATLMGFSAFPPYSAQTGAFAPDPAHMFDFLETLRTRGKTPAPVGGKRPLDIYGPHVPAATPPRPGYIQASYGPRGGGAYTYGGGGGRFGGGARRGGGGGGGAGGQEDVSAGSAGAAQMQVMEELTKAGYSPDEAAAMTSNLTFESGAGLSTHTGGDRGTAWGIAQWRLDRLAALKQFAAERNKPWTDRRTQAQFYAQEFKTYRGGAAYRLLKQGRYNEAFANYERYAGWNTGGMQNRARRAGGISKLYAGRESGTARAGADMQETEAPGSPRLKKQKQEVELNYKWTPDSGQFGRKDFRHKNNQWVRNQLYMAHSGDITGA